MSTHPTPAPLDVVTLAIAIAAAWLGDELAPAAGTYAVILLCALGGAGWSASGREMNTTRSAFVHILLMVGLSLVLTVPLAEGLSLMFNINARWMVAPLAVVIAARPEWVIDRIRGWFDHRTQHRPPEGGQP